MRSQTNFLISWRIWCHTHTHTYTSVLNLYFHNLNTEIFALILIETLLALTLLHLISWVTGLASKCLYQQYITLRHTIDCCMIVVLYDPDKPCYRSVCYYAVPSTTHHYPAPLSCCRHLDPPPQPHTVTSSGLLGGQIPEVSTKQSF